MGLSASPGADLAVLAALVAVVVIVVLACLHRAGGQDHFSARGDPAESEGDAPPLPWALAHGYPYNFSLGLDDPASADMYRFYSTAEVDPSVTGQLYAGQRAAGVNRRWVYGGRTSHGHKWGMREFSTGVPGQVGVDVGPLGLREYSLDGKPDVFDDGIPENWQMPSTPVSWYVPRLEDYYDVEAQRAAVYEPHLMPLQEPDHEPLVS